MPYDAKVPLAKSISTDIEQGESESNSSSSRSLSTERLQDHSQNENDNEKSPWSSEPDDNSPSEDKEGDLIKKSKTKKIAVYDDVDETSAAKRLITARTLINSAKFGQTTRRGPRRKKKRRPTSSIFPRIKNRCTRFCLSILEDDSVYLVVLGVLMGIFSFAIDFCTDSLRKMQFYLFELAGSIDLIMQYAVWVLYTLILVLSSAVICFFIAPQAAGSGIPEMKTILRGVVLKEYLTIRTLIAKLLGLILALGTGLPIGKEGPFVHIASMLARLLSYCAVSFKGVFESENRHTEMLAAACAVGVASTYGAPVGGVLFSIEVTSVFFPLRNYWRGFLATVCSAVTFRLLDVWFQERETIVAFSATKFQSDYPFDPKELLIFASIGIICGLGAAAFIWFHRIYVTWFMQNSKIKKMLFTFPFVYPLVIVFLIASIKCPLGYGHYFAGGLSPRDALGHLFTNFSWLDRNATLYNNESQAIFEYWADGRNIFVTLSLYTLNMFWMTAIAITLPVPCGVFIPVFVCGAAFGRAVGEAMACIFPDGVRTDGLITKIVPGAYAIVGATAFSGGVTHALSTSVLMVEITGQILYMLPTMLAVLLANAVCAKLQPSIYDSMICIKKLPYIPAIPPVSSGIHHVFVRDIMVTNVKFITLETTYGELQDMLTEHPKIKAFPLVDQNSSLILLGSVSRVQLFDAIEDQVGERARKFEALQRRRKVNRVMTSDDLKKVLHDGLQNKGEEVPPQAEPVERKISRFSVKRISSLDALTPSTSVVKEDKSTARMKHSSGQSQSPDTPTSTYNKFRSTIHMFSNYMNSLPFKFRQSLRRSANQPLLAEPDLTGPERLEWENNRLRDQLNFDSIQIDPAPFQLVERTSLYRVHALFWLLGLNRAYVTSLGRLVGVVALHELRLALEKTTQFLMPSNRKRPMDESDGVGKSPILPVIRDAAKAARLNSINPSAFVPSQTAILRIPKPAKK